MGPILEAGSWNLVKKTLNWLALLSGILLGVGTIPAVTEQDGNA